MATTTPAPQPWQPDTQTPLAPGAPRSDQASTVDALLAFKSESKTESQNPAVSMPRPAGARPAWVKTFAMVAGLAGLAALAATALRSSSFAEARRAASVTPSTTPLVGPAEGTLTVDSRPEGAQVSVDNIARGTTPLKLTLAAGEHTLELQNGSALRSVPLVIQPSVVMSQYIDLPAAAPVSSGRIDVTSDPPGARVSVDGVPRGVTPASIGNIGAGTHTVTIVDDSATVTRTVAVSAGSTASVVASLLPAGPSAGWIAFRAPFEMQVLEGGRLVGSTGAERFMLPAGRHELVLASPALEFESAMTVQVGAGTTVTPIVTIPNGVLSINATPWADVFLDGRAVGTTPLANLPVAIGSHEIVFRHPQFGEQRQTIVVKARTPARIGVSLAK
jgi:PEGA domain